VRSLLEGTLGRDVNPPGSAAWAEARLGRGGIVSLEWTEPCPESCPSGLCSFVLMGGYQLRLGVLGVPLIMVPDNKDKIRANWTSK
jgi:hypothetical protein